MPRKPKQAKHKGVYEKFAGSGIWWIRYTDAQGVRRKLSVGTHSEACKLYDRYTTEIRLGILQKPIVKGDTKFSEVVALGIKYSAEHHSDDPSYGNRVGKALPEFGHRISDSITSKEMQAFLDREATEREWAGATKNRHKAALSTAFREAIREELIQNNPMKMVRRAKESPGKLRFLSEDEEAQLRLAVSHLPFCLAQLDVALYTGIRKSEQFKARLSQVDLSLRHIYLPKTKNGDARYVNLNSALIKTFSSLQAEHTRRGLPNDAPIFLSQKDNPIANPRKWFETALARVGVSGVTWHTLRHTFASRLVMAGVDLRTVQVLMGHKTVSMTARYSHLAPAHEMRALELLVPKEDFSMRTIPRIDPQVVTSANAGSGGRKK